MKTSILATAALAALSALSAANAAITITVSSLGVPNDGNSATVQGDLIGYHAYLIQADAGAGSTISGVDFSAEGTAGKNITAAVHQSWFINTVRGVSTASTTVTSTVKANNSGDDSYDSHFLYNPANVGFGSNPTENNDAFVITNSSTNAGTRGTGTSPFVAFNGNALVDGGGDAYGSSNMLAVAFGVLSNATQITDLAYLVVPDSLHLTSAFTIATPQLASGGVSSGGQFTPIVIPALTSAPEPTSLALLGIASAGLLTRRRRA